STTDVEVKDRSGWVVEVKRVTTFVVLGAPLVVAGWEFVATIAWDSETKLAITRPVPGYDVDLSAHRGSQLCEHCNTNRDRKDTYVIRELDTGVTKQVGRNCLAAFLGIDPSGALYLVGEVF